MTDNAYPDALPAEYRLHWYVLERVLGQGGFGITYLARDTNLDRLVAIKEYLPGEVAQRRSDGTVRERTNAQGERYHWGLERFLAEARTLARFDHPNIVRVHSVFEDNDTAYMVMRFEEGDNLATLLTKRGTLTEDDLLLILLPILEGLEQVHQAGFIHRDIKPENIHIRRDGSPVLLDFGSARQSLGRARTMTIVVAPGYAPLEQYYGNPETQGPWTDIYSLAATCYRVIAGHAPLDAIARTKGVLGSTRDVLVPAAAIGRGRYSERLLQAIDQGLELSEKERPQSVAEWRREIVGDAGPRRPASRLAESLEGSAKPVPPPPEPGRSPGRNSVLWATGGAALAAVVIGIFLQSRPIPPNVELRRPTPQGSPSPGAPSQETAPPGAMPPTATQKPGAIPKLPEQPSAESSGKPESGKHDEGKKPSKRTSLVTEASKGKAPKSETAPVPNSPQPVPNSQVAKLEPQPTTMSPEPSGKSQADVALVKAQGAIDQGDYAAALRIIEPLAHGGNPRAQLLLAHMFASGQGQRQNFFDAYLWYGLVARKGNVDATAKRNEVASKLQAAEIRQADRIIESWQPRATDAGSGTQ